MSGFTVRPHCHLWLGILLTGFSAGCQPKNEFVPPPPPKVTVAQPQQQKVADTVEFTGSTKATGTVELRSRVGGYLERIAFTDGTTVGEGDLLFVIDPAPFEAALAAAKANQQKTEAALQLADVNLARSIELAQKKTIAQQQLDIDKAERASAVADVKSAKAAVRQAELNLAYTEIRAPMKGRVGRHLVDVGALVHAEDTPLAVIESIDPIYAYFYVSESELLRFIKLLREHKLPDPDKKPPELHLGLANETDVPHVGHLDFRELGVDPGTGTVLRRGIFPNPDQLLIPGLFVRIRASIGEPEPQLLVEQRALATDQRGDYVLVVNQSNEVEYRPVKTGIAVEQMQVVEEGLTAEDWVIVNGLQRARPGAKVVSERISVARDSSQKQPAEKEEGAKRPTRTRAPRAS